MKNLAGIATHISNTISSIELWNAGVEAFVGELCKPHEVLASVVGIMSFTGGAEALFQRQGKHWSVQCSQPLPRERVQDLRSAVNLCLFNDELDSARPGCWVETQEGLNLIVQVFKNAFGVSCQVNPRKLVHTIESIVHGSLKRAQAPKSDIDLAAIEIAGLHALGSAYACYERMERCYEEAVTVAIKAFGKDSREAHNTQVVLSNLYREEARRLKRLCAISPALTKTDLCCLTDDLRRVQSRRVRVLHEIRRHKEARSVRNETAEIETVTLRIRRATFPTFQLLRAAPNGRDGHFQLWLRSQGEPGNFRYRWELFYQSQHPDGRLGRRCALNSGVPEKDIHIAVEQGLEVLRKEVSQS